MRRMSFSATTEQMHSGQKTVTRRAPETWKLLKPGDRLMAVEKAMGLAKGEKQRKIGEIEIISNTVEYLADLTDAEVEAEGFPGCSRGWFLSNVWRDLHGPYNNADQVRRIKFRHIGLIAAAPIPAVHPISSTAEGGRPMTPYYADDHVTIYHADSHRMLADGLTGFDLVVTDPPYGMDYQSNWGAGHALVAGDKATQARDDVLGLLDGLPMLVFGRWSAQKPANVKHRLIWSKAPDPGMGDLSCPWGHSEEEIYVIGDGFSNARRRPNVLTFPKPPISSIERGHPTPKPVSLMRDLLECCPPGVILDPFMGSGSTLMAAKHLGRRAIGIEIDEKYCELAALRLGQEVLDFGSVA